MTHLMTTPDKQYKKPQMKKKEEEPKEEPKEEKTSLLEDALSFKELCENYIKEYGDQK